MEKENAINFLLYSTMGVTLDSDRNQLVTAAIDRAYRDASSHVLSSSDKGTAKENASNQISDAIKEGLSGKTYDKWHKELCVELVETYSKVTADEDRPFTYGIAQKWVNMTMKYLCVIKSIFEACGQSGEASWEILDKSEAELHIPVDRLILKTASDMGIKLPKKDDGTPKPWSKYETYEEYGALQEALKGKLNGKSPLDWEGPIWIELSKKTKRNGV